MAERPACGFDGATERQQHAEQMNAIALACGYWGVWTPKSLTEMVARQKAQVDTHAEQIAEKDYAIEALGDICDEYARQRSAAESREAALRAELAIEKAANKELADVNRKNFDIACFREMDIRSQLATARQEIETLKQALGEV